jgi:hypothetical protein
MRVLGIPLVGVRVWGLLLLLLLLLHKVCRVQGITLRLGQREWRLLLLMTTES